MFLIYCRKTILGFIWYQGNREICPFVTAKKAIKHANELAEPSLAGLEALRGKRIRVRFTFISYSPPLRRKLNLTCSVFLYFQTLFSKLDILEEMEGKQKSAEKPQRGTSFTNKNKTKNKLTRKN